MIWSPFSPFLGNIASEIDVYYHLLLVYTKKSSYHVLADEGVK